MDIWSKDVSRVGQNKEVQDFTIVYRREEIQDLGVVHF